MKIYAAPLVMGATFLAAGTAFLAAVPQHHNTPSVKLEQPAAATATTTQAPSLAPMGSASPSASKSVKVVRKAAVAPLNVTDSPTATIDPSSSPSPSETAPATTDAPSPTDSMRAPTAPPYIPPTYDPTPPQPTGNPSPPVTGHPWN